MAERKLAGRSSLIKWVFICVVMYIGFMAMKQAYYVMTAPPAQYEQATKLPLPDGSHVMIYIEPGTNKLCRAYSLGGIYCD